MNVTGYHFLRMKYLQSYLLNYTILSALGTSSSGFSRLKDAHPNVYLVIQAEKEQLFLFSCIQ